MGYDNADGRRRTLGHGETGAKVALPIFEAIVQSVWTDYAPRTVLSPPSPQARRQLVQLPIDLTSGDRLPKGARAFMEYFHVDRQGEVDDTQYRLVAADDVFARRSPETQDSGSSPSGYDDYGRIAPFWQRQPQWPKWGGYQGRFWWGGDDRPQPRRVDPDYSWGQRRPGSVRMIRGFSLLIALATPGLLTAARADGFQVVDVPSISAAASFRDPHVIAFSDHRRDELADPATGLIAFDAWARSMPLEKQALSPYPGYAEPTHNLTVNGVTKTARDKLHMYVAEARFVLPRPPQTILLQPALVNRWLSIDPAISHRPLIPAEADNGSNPNAERAWCQLKQNLLCFQSRYNLEGKLPAAIHLLNKLVESKKKIADYLEFQSEFEILTAAEIEAKHLAALTGSPGAILGGLQQTIFHVNQILQFGKLLCIFQQDTLDNGRTVVSVFMALAIKTRVLEKQKKYELGACAAQSDPLAAPGGEQLL